MKSALAVGTVAALCAALAQQGAAQAAGTTVHAAGGGARATPQQDGANDFIVRCFFNTHIAHQDPIEAPGDPHADHLHDFFGNLAGGTTAGDGTTTFPNIQSGDYTVSAATMEQNQLSPQTNCQDTKDTAGYWIPAPYMVDSSAGGNPKPWQDKNGCMMGCSDTGSGENFHMRVYYIPNGNQIPTEIPDGTIMVAGFPTGCATVSGLQAPDGCSGGTNYPVDTNIITYACGANTGSGFGTPLSAWPYDCTKFVNPNKIMDPDDIYSDGAVAMVRFPYCWDGQAHFPAPNSSPSAPVMVPGYVAPWIQYPYQHYGLSKRPVNDFVYPGSNGNCDPNGNYPHQVVQLEERIHLLSYGAGWGDPSSCVGDSGLDWNSSANAESSNNAGDTKPGGDGDGDADAKIGPSLWVPYQCPTNVTAPDPSPGATMLSFACTHGGDTNCNIPLTSGPAGCSSMGGTCYVGAYNPAPTKPSYGWETLHADYWQTWQEASNMNKNLDNTLVGGQLTDGVASDVGTFGDVVEDCTSGPSGPTSVKCKPAFIVTSQNSPSLVYGGG
jgi:hypothetical protein